MSDTYRTAIKGFVNQEENLKIDAKIPGGGFESRSIVVSIFLVLVKTQEHDLLSNAW